MSLNFYINFYPKRFICHIAVLADGTSETFLKGWFVHYNFVRPHQSLDGKTPAEASGIKLGLKDGWGDLIEKAIEYKAMKEKNNGQVMYALNVGKAEVRVIA